MKNSKVPFTDADALAAIRALEAAAIPGDEVMEIIQCDIEFLKELGLIE